MSREIKFRAYSKSRNRYLGKGDTLIYRHEVGLDGSRWWASLVERQDHADEDIIVEQYTGLKDKNGKELFDGDVVKYLDTCCHLVIAKVKWFERFNMDDEGEPSIIAGFMLCDGTIVDVSNGELNKAIDELKDSFEIIGNIHENPELLEGEL